VLQFTNQWKPVQAYYAIYFHLVTLHFVVNAIVPKHHEPTLRYATQTILPWFPQPWCLRFNHNTTTLDEFPPGTPIKAPSGWNVSRATESNTYIACFFRTTAQRDQQEKWRQHYKNKKKRIEAGPRAGKIYATADVKVDPVSFFNVLWRFRRWANYLDADTIIEGGDYTPHAVEFDSSFSEIVETTALTCENILKRCIGSDRLRDLYREYLALAGGHLDCATVERRLSTLCP